MPLAIPYVSTPENFALIREKDERGPSHDECIALREFKDHDGGLPLVRNWYDQTPYGLEVFRILSLFRETGDPKYLGEAGRLLNNPILFESLEDLQKYCVKGTDKEEGAAVNNETPKTPKRDLQQTAQPALALLEAMGKTTKEKKRILKH